MPLPRRPDVPLSFSFLFLHRIIFIIVIFLRIAAQFAPRRRVTSSSSLSPNHRISRFRFPSPVHSRGRCYSLLILLVLASNSPLSLFLIPLISTGEFSNFLHEYNYGILNLYKWLNNKYGLIQISDLS